MNAARWHRIEQLYNSARELEAASRNTYLTDACGSDEDLRREVESLLAQEGATDGASETCTILNVGADLGPYKIVGPLGAGGMGTVYRALDTRLGRAVAIKISAAQFSARFSREARAAAAINHPYICTLHDVGPNYLVMELVQGETLEARIAKGPLPAESVLRYAIQ